MSRSRCSSSPGLKRHDDLTRAGLVMFFVVAVVAIAAYLSGNAAEAVVQDRSDISPRAIRAHEDAALLAFVFMEITGFLAWLALWQWRRVPKLDRWQLPVVLLSAVVAFGLMARAAELGGEIHHAEIRVAAPAAKEAEAEAAAGTAQAIGMFVSGHPWVWPTAETLHFIGLSLLFTVVLIVDLRLLGMARRVPYAAVYQLLPLGMLGFGMNLVTGLLFFMAALAAIHPQQGVLLEDPLRRARRDQSPVLHARRRRLGHRTRRRCAAAVEDRGGVGDLPVGRRPVLRPHAAVHRQRVLRMPALGSTCLPRRVGRGAGRRRGGVPDQHGSTSHDGLAAVHRGQCVGGLAEGVAVALGLHNAVVPAHRRAVRLPSDPSVAIDMRILGVGRRIPLAPFDAFFKVIWIAFAVSAASGTVLFFSDATAKLANPAYLVKMTLVCIAAAITIAIRRRVFRPAAVDAGPVDGSSRYLAAASILCWFGAITAGRYIAYF